MTAVLLFIGLLFTCGVYGSSFVWPIISPESSSGAKSSYLFRIRAHNEYGWGDWSISCSPVEAFAPNVFFML